MTARQGTRVEQVCNRKGITWKEPRGQFLDSAENRGGARDTQPIGGVSDEFARECKRW